MHCSKSIESYKPGEAAAADSRMQLNTKLMLGEHGDMHGTA
jgi:hypothetical protein